MPLLSRLSALWRRLAARLSRTVDPGLFAVLLAFALLQLGHVGFVPIWDSGQYSECLLDAAGAGRGPASLNCFGHPTMAYLLPLAAALWLFPGSATALHVTNLLLGGLAVAAFHRLAKKALAGGRAGPLLATATFALLPMWNGNLLNWTPDFGVAVFFLPFLAALVEARVLVAALWGVALVFSKESGALLYGLACGCWGLALLASRPSRRQLAEGLSRALPLSVPPLLLVAFLLGGSSASGGGSPLWRGTSLGEVVRSLFSFSLDRHLASHAAGLFVISFDWVMAPVLVLGAALGLYRLARRRRVEDEAGRARLFVALLLAGGFLLLTRFRTFAHPRYLLALHPVLVLSFASALLALVRPRAVRHALAAAVLLLVFASNFRTLDPVSRRLWGTFDFGRHPMLKMTSIARECCGDGLDGLVYNLEFAHIHRLENRIFADYRPTPPTAVAMAEWSHWFVVTRLDAQTHRRTLARRGAYTVDHYGIEPGRPPPPGRARLLFVEYPQMNPATALAITAERYREVERREYEDGGYKLVAHLFEPR